MLNALISNCAVCKKPIGRIIHHYPSRKAPHNTPYYASIYHRDPFWNKGSFEEYCGAVCSTHAFLKGSHD